MDLSSKTKILELKPVREKISYYDRLESRIKEHFKKHLYYPLLEELGLFKSTIQNESDTLLKAIQSGRLTLKGKRIEGKLNATLTKELRALGAKWDRKSASFIFTSGVPPEVKMASAVSVARFEEKLKKIDQKLAKILPADFAKQVKSSDIFDSLLWDTEKKLQDTMNAITVLPNLSEDQTSRVSKEWQENMDLWITDFTEKQIKDLRKEVKESILKGDRQKALKDSILKSYGITERKAKFLARQETSLLLAKFKEVRYNAAGVNEYRWRTVVGSPAHPVRPAHKILDGKIFRFDNPPVTTEPGEPQRRNNPGEDFNCRCTSIPIVKFSERR